MAANALIGLAVTSHNNSSPCTAVFDNLTAPNWPLLPGTPTNLAASAGNALVSLSWAATTNATSYNVKRALTSGGPYGSITNVSTTTYSDLGLSNDTTYFYVVSALNIAGESANSSETSATPQAPPTLNISLTDTNLTISWPPSPAGFTLQTCTNLAPASWSTVTSPAPAMMGGQWQLTLPRSADTASAFYRLSK
jgi:hypothetical protein